MNYRLDRQMIQTRFDEPHELNMQDVFIRQAEDICSRMDEFMIDDSILMLGLESEYSLLTDGYKQADQAIRDQILQIGSEFLTKELGAAQIEMWTDPHDILDHGIGNLIEEYRIKENKLTKLVKGFNHKILRSGSNPFVPLSEVKTTEGPLKYKLSMAFHRQNRCQNQETKIGEINQVDVADPSCISLFNAVHPNIDCLSINDAVDKLNRSLMLSPMVTVLGGNATLLEGKNTGIADLRFIAWQISHDVRSEEEILAGLTTRIGLPNRYYLDIHDYFNQLLNHPFIIGADENARDHALEVAIGLNWRDARIKFYEGIRKVAVVEFRALAMQPNLYEDVALTLFYIGRLIWSQLKNEELMPMEIVQQDKIEAMHYGVNAKLHFRDQNGNLKVAIPKDCLPLEFARATEGLQYLGVKLEEFKYPFDMYLPYKNAQASLGHCFAETFQGYLDSGDDQEEALAKTYQSCCF